MKSPQLAANLSFLINQNPHIQFNWIPWTAGFAVIFIIGAILSFIKKLNASKWRDSAAQWLRWLGFAGLLFTFFWYQQLDYLAMPLLAVLTTLGLLIWLGFIVKKLTVKTVDPAEQAKRYQTFEKYLPRPKAKNLSRNSIGNSRNRS
jgi:hypothetical protein